VRRREGEERKDNERDAENERFVAISWWRGWAITAEARNEEWGTRERREMNFKDEEMKR